MIQLLAGRERGSQRGSKNFSEPAEFHKVGGEVAAETRTPLAVQVYLQWRETRGVEVGAGFRDPVT